MIEIFKYLKTPATMNEMFKLHNNPYNIRNVRKLNGQVLKSGYCPPEATYVVVTTKQKKSSPLARFNRA